MIIHPTQTGWHIIYQRAHALLAGQIGFHWRPEERPVQWMAMLAAITQHDDGGREWEGTDLLTAAGAPKDFKVSDLSLRQPTESVMHAQYQGQFVALMQSMHVYRLYRDFRDEPGFAEFLDEQQTRQAQWRKALKLSKAEAERDYRLLYWCDSMSLILCQRHLPSDGRAIEVGEGPDGTMYSARLKEDSGGIDPRAAQGAAVVHIEPWPFAVPSFEVGIEATTIEGLTFEDDAALVAAMRGGVIEMLTWRFEKARR